MLSFVYGGNLRDRWEGLIDETTLFVSLTLNSWSGSRCKDKNQ